MSKSELNFPEIAYSIIDAVRPLISQSVNVAAYLRGEDDDPLKDYETGEVAESKAVAQIISMKGMPALRRVAGTPSPRGYHCHGDTIVTVKLADGTTQEHNYKSGTFIDVSDGLVNFPPDNGPI